MSGDKQKVDKLAEILYKLSLRDDFNTDIRKLRKRYKIPFSGFQNTEEIKEWLFNKRQSLTYIELTEDKEGAFINPITFYIVLGDLLKKYKVPPMLNLLEEYLLHNGRIVRVGNQESGAPCLVTIPQEEESKPFGRPFAKLLIFDQASENDVKDFIVKNWHQIKTVINRQLNKTDARIRVRLNKKRDELIYNLSLKSKQELELIRGTWSPYKDIAIATILQEKYGFKKITPENVRNIISRQRKLRLSNN